MSFGTGYLDDPQAVGAGEIIASAPYIQLTATTFEDGLIVGRFAKMDSGSLDNVDSSATPVIAGVVTRNPVAAVENGDTINTPNDLYSRAEYVRQGIVTVEVDSADSPAMFGAVYVENQTPADYGKATTVSAGNVAVNAEFLYEVQTDVWAIRLY